MTCEHYQALLLEYLYDLLDSDLSAQLRQHVAECPACAAALKQVEHYQRLLAEAARPCREVPLFTPPAEELPTQEPVHPLIPGEAVGQPPSPHRAVRRWRRPVAVLATAALLLLAVGSWLWYDRGLARRTQQLDLARAHLQDQERQLRQLEGELQQQIEHLDHRLRQQYFLVEMNGPAVYTLGAPGRLRIQTQELKTRTPLPSTIQAQLVEPDSQRVVYRTRLQADQGQALLLLPEDLPLSPGKPVRLQVTAQGPAGEQQLQQDLAVEAPSYLAWVAPDSTQLRPGTPLQIRALLLERFSLRPPSRMPPQLTFWLLGPQGKIFWQTRAACEPNGLTLAQLIPATDWPEGKYRLYLTAASARVWTVVPVLERRSSPLLAAELQRTERNAVLRGKAVSSWHVRFFPEGGALVAGLPARLWCQVQAPVSLHQPLTARLVDQRGKVIQEHILLAPLKGAASAQAAGVLDFTPEAKQSYRLQLQVEKQSLGDYPLPAVQEQGVTLHVPAAVGKEGEPIIVQVRATETLPSLLLLAECRGQIVEQRWITASSAGTEVSLRPLPGSRGALRLAIYEPRGNQLVLRSQRWVYQAPSQFLQLHLMTTPKTSTAPTPPLMGTSQTLTVRATTETAQPAAAWTLIALTPAGGGDIQKIYLSPYYFYLELINQEAMEEDLLQADDRQALELFLVSRGRVQPTPPPMLVASPLGQQVLSLATAGPAVFQRTNLDAVKAGYEQARTEQVHQLQGQFLPRLEVLRRERDQAEQAVLAATQSLMDYRQAWTEAAGLGLALLWLILLVAGLAALVWSLYHLWRGQTSATLPLTCALTSLAAALLLWLTASSWLVPSENRVAPVDEVLARRSPHAASRPTEPETLQSPSGPAAEPPRGTWQEPHAADRYGASRQDFPKADRASPRRQTPRSVQEARTDQGNPPVAVPVMRPVGEGHAPSTPAAGNGMKEQAALPLVGASPGPRTPSPMAPSSSKEMAKAAVMAHPSETLLSTQTSSPGVLFWQLAQLLPQKGASVSVAQPFSAGPYRVWVFAYDAQGRLGWATLEVSSPKK